MAKRTKKGKGGKGPSLEKLMKPEGGKPKPSLAAAMYPHLKSALALMPGAALAKGRGQK